MAKRSKAAKKTSAKTSAADLVPQPHGGALRRGGKPGNKGGGRPKNETRARLRAAIDDLGVDYVRSVLGGQEAEATVQDRLAAFDRAAKYGLGALKGVSDEDLRERVRETLQVVYNVLGEVGYNAALPQLKAIWTSK